MKIKKEKAKNFVSSIEIAQTKTKINHLEKNKVDVVSPKEFKKIVTNIKNTAKT